MIEWHDTVSWGGGLPGTIQVVFSPKGSLKATVRKLSPDLEGRDAWVCKRVYPLNLGGKKTEQDWVGYIHEDLKRIAKEGQDGANREFPKLPRFVTDLAGKVKQEAPEVFVFEGVRRSDDDNYVIFMSYRGQGLQRRGQTRCEQYNINVSFRKEKGLLHCWGYDVRSPIRGHKWEVCPAEWNEVFAPSQGSQEIIRAVVECVRSY